METPIAVTRKLVPAKSEILKGLIRASGYLHVISTSTH
jgi:hypothetical protein